MTCGSPDVYIGWTKSHKKSIIYIISPSISFVVINDHLSSSLNWLNLLLYFKLKYFICIQYVVLLAFQYVWRCFKSQIAAPSAFSTKFINMIVLVYLFIWALWHIEFGIAISPFGAEGKLHNFKNRHEAGI